LTASTSFSALGSTAVVVASEGEHLPAAVQAVTRTVDAFDRACSRFREDSDLSAVNRAAGRATPVGPLMIEATQAAVRAAALTDGDVDPTLGTAIVALGYDRDFDAGLNGRGALGAGARPLLGGWQTIRVDPTAGTVSIVPGATLDLGATAKALAADHAATAAFEAAGCGVLVSLGGDIAIAGPSPAEGWPVRVTDDHRARADAPGQTILLQSGALATSSTTVRKWRGANGAPVHHLLDPATGQPANGGWRTASVTAACCLDANIASTAAVVRGPRAPDWLRSLGLPSRLVSEDGTALHLCGWPEDGDDLAPARPIEASA
jgi:thiamine biosynthesis lipoprotein